MPESPGTARPGARTERDLPLLLAGGVAAALGLLVLVGWHSHRATLVQVLPALVPMQYNTALGFLIGGGGYVAIALGRRRLAVGAGLLVATLGLLTLLEYVLDVGLGIDQFLFTSYITVGTSDPGRMSPLTAMNVVLAGGALVLLGLPMRGDRRALMLGTVGSVVTAVAAMALLGYLSRRSIGYVLGPYTRMAVHTAGGFVVLGAGMFASAWREATVGGMRAPRWLPVPIAIGSLAVTLVLCQSLSVREAGDLDRATEIVLVAASERIPEEVLVRLQPLVRMAGRLEQEELQPAARWEADASLILEDYPSLRAIERADSSFTVRRIMPPAGNEAAQDLYLGFEESRLSALEAVRAGAEVAITQAVEFVQGGEGSLAVIPIRGGQEGFLVGVVDTRQLLETALTFHSPGYSIAVLEDGTEVYRRSGTDDLQYESEYGQQADVDIDGVRWRVRVWPGADVVAAAQSALPGVVLALGAAMSLLLAAAVGLTQTSRHRARQAEAANRDLSVEIAARSRAERRAEERQHRLLRAERVARMGFLDLDLRTNTIEWSDEVYRLYGIDPDEVKVTLELTVSLLHPDDLERVRTNLERAQQGLEYEDIDHRIVRPDGVVVWVHAQMELIRDADGTPARLLGTVVDITKRKLAEETFRSLLESAPDAMVVVREDGTISIINGQAEKLFGYPREEMLGQSVDMLVPKSVLGTHAKHRAGFFSAASTRAMGVGLDLFALHKNGSEIPVEVGLSPIETAEGTLVSVSIRDVTERRRAGAERERLGLAVEQATDSVVITDVDGTIHYVNRMFELTTGYTRAEVIGQNPRILKSGKHDPAFYRAMWDTLTGGEAWTGEVINKRKDGTLYQKQQTVFPVAGPVGEMVNYVSIGRDVTRERALEAQLRQAQKMEAVGRLAGGVAHDFNNILTIISVTTELMLGDIEPGDERRRDLEEIKGAAERAAALTRQLLAFSRQQVIEPRVIDLNAVVGNVEKMLGRLIGEDVELSTALEPRLGTVRADAGQIEQVIMNLVVNARDAMPRGGNLTIETANVDLDETYVDTHLGAQPGRYVMLAVTDDGVGMDADTRAHVFEPFFTTKERGKGTGLGLATVYGIIKQSEGYVWLYSEPGQGTTFKIYLPRVDSEVDKSLPRADASASQRGSETVLLAEDEEGVRKVVATILASLGYRVLMATDGDEALRIAGTHDDTIDVLITDVVMPGMGGRELSERLRATRPGVKTLYLSGYTDDTIVRYGVLEAGVAFLQKPFTVERLARKVREVLGVR